MMINQAKDVVRRVAVGNGKQSPEHLLNNASNKVVVIIKMIMMMRVMIMMLVMMTMTTMRNISSRMKDENES